MKKFYVMDIETYEKENRVIPFLFTLKTHEKIYNFYAENFSDIIALFLNQIEKDSFKLNIHNIQVFTHNINFDGFILIEYFLNKNIPFKWFIRNLNLYYIDFNYKGLDIKIRCSYKILGASVKTLGEIIGENKKPFPYKFVNENTINYRGYIPSYKYFETKEDFLFFYKKWGKIINLKEIAIEYASYDVEIVYKSLIELFKISYKSLFNNSFSFSSYSYKLFSKKYDINQITKTKLKLYERNYIENAYFGGRTEIFGNTKNGLIHRFDFPGMYGTCMKEKFPYGIISVSLPNEFKKPGFYTATVVSDLKIPILPIRTKDKKIIYPNGRFTTCLSRDEFILFLEKGGKVEKIHSALTFDYEDYIFKEFVEEYEKIKLMGGFYKLYGKQVINSLYGSFALKKDEINYIILYDENELNFLNEELRIKKFSKHNKMIIAGVEVNNSLNFRENRNVSYASFIASKARIKLHKNVYAVDDYYTKLYNEKYKLLYLETDSIDISLPSSHLGETIMDVTWQFIYEGGVFVSPKFYSLKGDTRSKIKGIRKSKYSYEEISSSFYENKNNLIFSSQLQFSKKNFILSQLYIDKALKISSYDKRIFSEDKLNTKPIYIWE